MHDVEGRHALVFAIAHELGNQLAGIRLEAHLLDEDLGAHGLARASLAIDSLAGQAGPWLALLRPLLAPPPPAAGRAGPDYAAVLEGVRRVLVDDGAGGRKIEVSIAEGAPEAHPAPDGLHPLLLAPVGPPEALPASRGPIRLSLDRRAGEAMLGCELLGDAFEGAAGAGDPAPIGPVPHGPALRGRTLAVALARRLAADVGGCVELAGDAERSRLTLILPLGA